MRTLLQTLVDTDEAVLSTITATWGLGERPKGKQAFVEALEALMLNAEKAEQVWDSLPDDQRQALQTLLASGNAQMPMAMYNKLFGEIRKMGRGAVEREQPHKSPMTAAEGLFYKGLIAEGIQMAANGSQKFAYVPDDLQLVLPTHKTGYDGIEAEPDPLTALDNRQLSSTQPADTSIVDDMTALLAFVQLHNPPVEGDSLAEGSLRALLPYLLTHGTARVAFMVTAGVTAGLLAVREGHVTTDRAQARGWLGASRSAQLKALVDAWLASEFYRELYHLSGITVENVTDYDPRIPRRTLLGKMKDTIPGAAWWDSEELVYLVRNSQPGFLRPNGDYASWYLLDAAGEYFKSDEDWELVESEILGYIIRGPMHWLGLLDVSPEAARLTAYGRGVVGMTPFPDPPEEPEPITVGTDGTLTVSRKVSRLDRFQAARFTSWGDAPPLGSEAAFSYKLDRAGVAQADAQGIETTHIRAFLGRMLGDDPLPERIEQVLTHWRGGGDTSTVTLSQVIVMQATSTQVLDDLLDDPEVRRFLGRRLGDRAVVVRDDQWEALSAALAEMGIQVNTVR